LQDPVVQVSVAPEQAAPAPHLQTPEVPKRILLKMGLLFTCIGSSRAGS